METREDLVAKLEKLTLPGTRDRLLSLGLARGIIWDKGVLPEQSRDFSPLLSDDLLNHGYSVLGCSLRLRAIDVNAEILEQSFRVSAESIEAAVRRGVRDEDRGFHLTVAAAAFHLGHYAARSFSLLAEDSETLNCSSVELLLAALMQRRLGELEGICLDWLENEAHSDEGVSRRLEDKSNNFLPSDASRIVVSRVFHRAIATFDFAIRTGDGEFVETATSLLDECIEAAEQLRHIPLWWISLLARHLIEDLWDRSLHHRLPLDPNSNDDRWPQLRRDFIDLVTRRQIAEIDLWPSQLAAASRVTDQDDSLVVALPTSSGKTRIAELCILKCLSAERRVIYVTPLRALSAQVEVTLARTFRPLGFSVTSVYGASGLGATDVETMESADIVVATPEKLDFAIRQSSDVIDDVGLIVLDEGHMIGLGEREIRYEILVQRLLRRADSEERRIVCLSAIFAEGEPFDAFTQWLRQDHPGDAIRSSWRPTRQRPATLEWLSESARLEYRVENEKVFIHRFIDAVPRQSGRSNAFPQNKAELIIAAINRFHRDGHSVLVYCPIRVSVEGVAEEFLKIMRQGYVKSLLPDEFQSEIETALRIGREWLGHKHTAVRALKVGIAVHHGQLPRPFLSELERLLRKKILKVATSSPTLAQGVDLSFSVLIFHSLWRNGAVIPAKEFANVVGRVGRAFVDLDAIFVQPVYEKGSSYLDRQLIQKKRLDEFHKLVRDARKRELESGFYEMIRGCLRLLRDRLNLSGDQLVEYVTNNQLAIDVLSSQDDEKANLLSVMFAELDAGILALVEELDCDVAEVAGRLDEALKSSYWQRRLAVRDLKEQVAQKALVRSRTKHIWNRTQPQQRSGFFAASIGMKSGLQIVEYAEKLQRLLSLATAAIVTNDSEALANACRRLAKVLFKIYPFEPSHIEDNGEGWEQILAMWVRGESLAGKTDSTGIAFVQDDLIYRLVWALEAARIVLYSVSDDLVYDDDMTYVAMCVTYGVPSIAAARILEAGMDSRLLAVQLADELQLTFSDRAGLLLWLEELNGAEPIRLSKDDREAWKRFVAANEPENQAWHRQNEQLDCDWFEACEPSTGCKVRVVTDKKGRGSVFGADFGRLGNVNSNQSTKESNIATVLEDSRIEIHRFGPGKLPHWLQEIVNELS